MIASVFCVIEEAARTIPFAPRTPPPSSVSYRRKNVLPLLYAGNGQNFNSGRQRGGGNQGQRTNFANNPNRGQQAQSFQATGGRGQARMQGQGQNRNVRR